MTRIPIFGRHRDLLGYRTCTYDAWNRLVKIESDDSTAVTLATMSYDGLNRRITKVIDNSGEDDPWDCEYHYYYNGNSMVETRDGSAVVLKQHVWGVMYIDELLQLTIPVGNDSRKFWALQDANYNVTNIVSVAGRQVERYEYSPYGERTVFSRPWFAADFNEDGVVDSDDYDIYLANFGSGTTFEEGDANGDGAVDLQDFGIYKADEDGIDGFVTTLLQSTYRRDLTGVVDLCDIGHQGLLHDKEWDWIYNRARYLIRPLGRFNGPDRLNQDIAGGGYHDGMSLYESRRSRPLRYVDPIGRTVIDDSGLGFIPVENAPDPFRPVFPPTQQPIRLPEETPSNLILDLLDEPQGYPFTDSPSLDMPPALTMPDIFKKYCRCKIELRYTSGQQSSGMLSYSHAKLTVYRSTKSDPKAGDWELWKPGGLVEFGAEFQPPIGKMRTWIPIGFFLRPLTVQTFGRLERHLWDKKGTSGKLHDTYVSEIGKMKPCENVMAAANVLNLEGYLYRLRSTNSNWAISRVLSQANVSLQAPPNSTGWGSGGQPKTQGEEDHEMGRLGYYR